MRATTAAAVTAAGLLLASSPAAVAARSATPAAVARAWSAALNRGDNEAAANLFAKNAVVVQGATEIRLTSHRLAVLWNRGLPCSGRILKLEVYADVADATFLLGDRRPLSCDAPGQKARAAFKIRNGKIVAWIQLPVAAEKPKPKKPGPIKA